MIDLDRKSGQLRRKRTLRNSETFMSVHNHVDTRKRQQPHKEELPIYQRSNLALTRLSQQTLDPRKMNLIQRHQEQHPERRNWRMSQLKLKGHLHCFQCQDPGCPSLNRSHLRRSKTPQGSKEEEAQKNTLTGVRHAQARLILDKRDEAAGKPAQLFKSTHSNTTAPDIWPIKPPSPPK